MDNDALIFVCSLLINLIQLLPVHIFFIKGEELLLADSCPVCSKIIKKRLSGLSHNVGPYKDKKRFASAFTRLSLKGMIISYL